MTEQIPGSAEPTGPLAGQTSSAKKFRILVCIDGSEESYRGLRYAARQGNGVDADICITFSLMLLPA